MSSKRTPQLAPSLEHEYEYDSPLPINKRKLPPLPINKRKLPQLPPQLQQSTSNYVSSPRNKCVESPRHASKFSPRGPRAIRNLFNRVQQKMGGTKTKLIKRKNVIGISQDDETTDDEDYNYNKSIIRSKWRPDLQYICDDNELLNTLIAFMTKQYNEENILFLQSVNDLYNNIHHLQVFTDEINIVKIEKINVEIRQIYNEYIINNAAKQINLSSRCYTNIMNIHQKFSEFPLNEKYKLFSECFDEISNLISTSILPSFYNNCDEFQSVCRSRNIYDNDNSNNLTTLGLNQVQISDRNSIDYDSDDIEYENSKDNLNDYYNTDVCFDVHSSNKWRENHNKYMLSSNGFDKNSGYHEWQIQIMKCDNNGRQEFGVISNFNKNIEMNEYGILDTPLFGARCVYGYNKLVKLNSNKKVKACRNNFYYASYNDNNTIRCNKDLSQLNIHQRKWKKGDVIKVCLDLTKGIVKFFLNGKKVRKTISVERNIIYYPIILYSGNCEYRVIQ